MYYKSRIMENSRITIKINKQTKKMAKLNQFFTFDVKLWTLMPFLSYSRGSAISLAVTYYIALMLLVAYIYFSQLYVETWDGITSIIFVQPFWWYNIVLRRKNHVD